MKGKLSPMKAVVKISFHEVYAFWGDKRLSTELSRNGKGDYKDLMENGGRGFEGLGGFLRWQSCEVSNAGHLGDPMRQGHQSEKAPAEEGSLPGAG